MLWLGVTGISGSVVVLYICVCVMGGISVLCFGVMLKCCLYMCCVV